VAVTGLRQAPRRTQRRAGREALQVSLSPVADKPLGSNVHDRCTYVESSKLVTVCAK